MLTLCVWLNPRSRFPGCPVGRRAPAVSATPSTHESCDTSKAKSPHAQRGGHHYFITGKAISKRCVLAHRKEKLNGFFKVLNTECL